MCGRVVEAVIQEGVGKVIVVDNGCVGQSRQVLERLALEHGAKLQLLHMKENTGSAGGFGAGLREARLHSAIKFAWLMDDDNMPIPGALDQLHKYRQTLQGWRDSRSLALLSLRDRRFGLMTIARGCSAARIFPPSSFLQFDMSMFPRKVLTRVAQRLRRAAIRDTPVQIPFAPYGGLLLSIEVLDEIGYPEERFFTYADDTEFTFRLAAAGGRIMLVPTSRVQEIDTPWPQASAGGNGLTRLLLSDSDFRVFYAVRNSVFFESHMWLGSRLRYSVNKCIYLALARMAGAALRRSKRVALIQRAVRDGEEGRLGRTFGDCES